MITSLQANTERVDFRELYEILAQIRFDTMTPLLHQHLYLVTMEKNSETTKLPLRRRWKLRLQIHLVHIVKVTHYISQQL